MRLIKLRDNGELVLTNFYKDIPSYAILSHTWGDANDEVTLQEFMDGSGKTKSGYRKIQSCAAQAASEGLQYTWYQDAIIYYGYLSNVDDFWGLDSSRWFKRGWTLQELLAPKMMVFYTRNWNKIDTRLNLAPTISRITRIPPEVFKNDFTGKYSVAQILSWVAGRQTTREEDIAYCLLGLLGVNMPLLYGEGSRAFERLQEEFMKRSTDHTLFTWRGAGTERGPLAQSPEELRDCRGFVEGKQDSTDFSMTNRGLRINLPIVEGKGGSLVAILNCVDAENRRLGIYLKRTRPDVYHRIRCADELPMIDSDEELPTPETLYIVPAAPRTLGRDRWQPNPAEYTFKVDFRSVSLNGFSLQQHYSPVSDNRWNISGSNGGFLEYTAIGSGNYGGLLFNNLETGEEFVVIVGIHNYKTWLDITTIGPSETFEHAVDEYYHFREKHDGNKIACRCEMQWKALDRMRKSLSRGMSASAMIENGESKHQFVVKVSVGKE
ncbi:HET domain-containing protein [Pyrenophora tritici-repentis]|nr:HET domain-containing protein [Pyrenophora tritici-repentis]